MQRVQWITASCVVSTSGRILVRGRALVLLAPAAVEAVASPDLSDRTAALVADRASSG